MNFDWIASVAPVLSAIAALSSAATAFMLFRVSREMGKFQKRTAKKEFFATFLKVANDMNSTVLADKDLLHIMETLGGPTKDDDPLYAKKKWVLFMFLNMQELAFIGHRGGLLDKSFAEPTTEDLLPILMRDDLAWECVSTRGYDKRFREHCSTVRKLVTARATTNPHISTAPIGELGTTEAE